MTEALHPPVFPYQRGQTLGVINAGQLGRMLAIAACNLNVKTIVWGQKLDDPAMQPASQQIIGPWDNEDCWNDFLAAKPAGILLDWENTPVWLIEKLGEAGVPVYNQADVLRIAQDRTYEKMSAFDQDVPTTFWISFDRPSPEESSPFRKEENRLDEGAYRIKTRRDGYDGKGQKRCGSVTEVIQATSYHALATTFGNDVTEFILEREVEDLAYECSVQVARKATGDVEFSPAVYNAHENGILRYSMWYDGLIPRDVETEAQDYAERSAEHNHVVGLLCSEFFVTHQAMVMKNEEAPRPHNSHHGGIEAANVSQFTWYVQAVTPGLSLQVMHFYGPWVMINLLGDEIDLIPQLIALGFSCHDYGKVEAKPGRKMGHVTYVGKSADDVQAKLEAAMMLLGQKI